MNNNGNNDKNNGDNDINDNDNNPFQLMMSQVCAGQVLSLQSSLS